MPGPAWSAGTTFSIRSRRTAGSAVSRTIRHSQPPPYPAVSSTAAAPPVAPVSVIGVGCWCHESPHQATSEPGRSPAAITSRPSCGPSPGWLHEYDTVVRCPPAAVATVSAAGDSASGSAGINRKPFVPAQDPVTSVRSIAPG
ncbi:hypothetical protein V2I01_18595 [Micromonospora sp. BRA006-A]|nr:hypothetical protein [Micromonospora sp. BRA006-A]